jgi:hypothetical protein
VVAEHAVAHGDAERGRRGGAGVAHQVGVVRRLPLVGEARQAALLPQRVEARLALGQQLVRVALVADVPDEAVVLEVEDVVQADRQFDDAHAGAEVAAGDRHRVEDDLAQFGAERRQDLARQLLQVGRAVDLVKQGRRGMGVQVLLREGVRA